MEKHNATCENCGRSNEVVQIEPLSIKGHVAELCLACSYILSKEESLKKYYQLSRTKSRISSNKEMKKVHNQLSLLIIVGMLFIITILALEIGQNFHLFPSISQEVAPLTQTQEYLSFNLLKQLK